MCVCTIVYPYIYPSLKIRLSKWQVVGFGCLAMAMARRSATELLQDLLSHSKSRDEVAGKGAGAGCWMSFRDGDGEGLLGGELPT